MKSLTQFLKENIIQERSYDAPVQCIYSFEDYCDWMNLSNHNITEDTHYQYMDYAFNQDMIFNCGANQWWFYEYYINENLLKSVKQDKLCEWILKTWPDIDITKPKSEKLLELSGPKNFFKDLIKTNNDSFMSLLRIANYFVLNCNEYDIRLHPWKPKEVTDKIFNEYDGIVYHITTKDNWKKIQKYGLSPKGKGWHTIHDKDKEREEFINDKLSDVFRPKLVYVLAKGDEKKFRSDYMMLSGLLRATRKIYNEWRIYDKEAQEKMNASLENLVILKINLKEFEYKYKVWVDPACKGMDAYFLAEYIPPMIIELYKEL